MREHCFKAGPTAEVLTTPPPPLANAGGQRAYRAGLRSREHDVAPRSDQPTGDLAAAAHRVLTDYAGSVRLQRCALSGAAARQGCIDLGVCQRCGLGSASGTAEP